jgi:transcriptional regulator with XRE-family HTH domain
MDDEEWLARMSPEKPDWEYHELCLWSPFIQETVDNIATGMEEDGFDKKETILIYEGKILDGRHRYLAAIKSGVDPIFEEFVGNREEAIKKVTNKQVSRGHWPNAAKEFFYAKRAEALGVRNREDSLKQNSTDVSNDTTVPSQEDHAESLGVSRPTIARWEADRKEIKSDPELAAKAVTPEGYQEAKKVVKERRKKQKEAIKNTVAPDVIDLNAIAKSKKQTDIRSVGPAFVGLMETLCTKFDERDIKRELVAFMYPDPLGLKAEALHKMADILSDLREDFSTETAKQQLN